MNTLLFFSFLNNLVFCQGTEWGEYVRTHIHYNQAKQAFKTMYCNASFKLRTIWGMFLEMHFSMFSCQKLGLLDTKLCQFQKIPWKLKLFFFTGSSLLVTFTVKNVAGKALPSDRTFQERFGSMHTITGSMYTPVEHVHTSVEHVHTSS